MKKITSVLLTVLMLAMIAAATEFRSGDLINIRVPLVIDGTPTSGGTCLLDLYGNEKVVDGQAMSDLADGWYNYTIDGWLTSLNGTSYTGYAYCSKDNLSGVTTFSFTFTQEPVDTWLGIINQTTSGIHDDTTSINQTVGGIKDDTASINQTLGAIAGNISSQGGFFDRIYLMLRDLFEFQSKDVEHWNLVVAADNNFTTVMQDRLVSSSELQLQNLQLADGLYYARVRMFDPASKRYGFWSETVEFTLQNSTA